MPIARTIKFSADMYKIPDDMPMTQVVDFLATVLKLIPLKYTGEEEISGYNTDILLRTIDIPSTTESIEE